MKFEGKRGKGTNENMRFETSNINDLTDLHRMGHTCANLNGELLFIWGGSDESIAYQSVRNPHLWIYETLTGYWRHRSCSGECPPYLSGTTSSLIGQRMFVFGGHSTAQDNWLNSLYCLDLETFVWRDLGSQANAEPTKPVRSDKCVSWSYDGRFYIFGGYGWSQTEHFLQLLDRQKDLQLTPDYRWPKFGWNNQLVVYNPTDNTWTWPSYSGKCPSARAAHSGALMGSKYYLFGGRDSRERLNDLYTLDMETFEWTQIAAFSDPTHERPERPIGHLLESSYVDNNRQSIVAIEAEVEDGVVHDAIGAENLTISPSTSAPPQEDLSSASSTSNQIDDDEDPDNPFNYPHPSHLLEHWSLSSHLTASSSSNMDLNVDCLYNSSLRQQSIDQSTSYTLSGPTQFGELQNSQLVAESISQQQQQAHLPVVGLVETGNDEPNAGEVARVPVGRSFSSFTPISDEEIMLFGGVSSQDENLDDCWMFNIKHRRWIQVNIESRNQPRLWHTGSRTKNNEVVIIGGSCSDKIDEFCTDVLMISMVPKTLKRLALDSVAKSIRMRAIQNFKGLPSTICKLIKLRKQAVALTMRRNHKVLKS